MALMNLTLLGELALEAYSQKHTCYAYCYNTDARPQSFDDSLFVQIIKTNKQAENLLDQLRKLHKECTDFSAGNMDAYLEEFEKWVDLEDGVFDPFKTLLYHFDGEVITDLPERIEQYDELVHLAAQYGLVKKAKDDALKQFFPGLTFSYRATNEAGDDIFIPEDQMPKDQLNTIESNQQIKQIEVEYCLDGYNEFYGKCLEIIHTYEPSGLIKACADEILSLYAPYQSNTPS